MEVYAYMYVSGWCLFKIEGYSASGYHSHASFCDVNLVDYGYAAYYSRRRPSRGGGYGSASAGYASPGGCAPNNQRRFNVVSYMYDVIMALITVVIEVLLL